jgi:hypothetical protein
MRLVQCTIVYRAITKYIYSVLVTSEVGKWLNRFDLGLYESYLLANGFDDLEFLVSCVK